MVESSSGIPQHWQISCRGEPKSVLIETSKNFDSSFSVSAFGIVSPFSQRDTACLVTWTFSASSSCERPFFVRSSRITSFVSIINHRLVKSIIQICYGNKQLAVAANTDLLFLFHRRVKKPQSGLFSRDYYIFSAFFKDWQKHRNESSQHFKLIGPRRLSRCIFPFVGL